MRYRVTKTSSGFRIAQLLVGHDYDKLLTYLWITSWLWLFKFHDSDHFLEFEFWTTVWDQVNSISFGFVWVQFSLSCFDFVKKEYTQPIRTSYIGTNKHTSHRTYGWCICSQLEVQQKQTCIYLIMFVQKPAHIPNTVGALFNCLVSARSHQRGYPSTLNRTWTKDERLIKHLHMM